MHADLEGMTMEPIDWTMLSENCAGDESLVHEVVALFRTEAPGLLRDVKAAVAAQDAAAIKRTAHRFKGALVSLAALPSVEAAKELERLGGLNQLGTTQQVCAQLELEIDRLLKAVSARAA